MRCKSAFNEGHSLENVGLFLFFAAGLTGLWYMVANVIPW
jgi:hypothetical protein